jgi:hypothetical protein
MAKRAARTETVGPSMAKQFEETVDVRMPRETLAAIARLAGYSDEEVRLLQGEAGANPRGAGIAAEMVNAMRETDQIIARLDVGVAKERMEMDALLARLRTTRIAA